MKWITLQPITIIQVAGVSHVLGPYKGINHKLDICATNEIRLLQNQVQLGIREKIQL